MVGVVDAVPADAIGGDVVAAVARRVVDHCGAIYNGQELTRRTRQHTDMQPTTMH